jgi:hypothetical protein
MGGSHARHAPPERAHCIVRACSRQLARMASACARTCGDGRTTRPWLPPRLVATTPPLRSRDERRGRPVARDRRRRRRGAGDRVARRRACDDAPADLGRRPATAVASVEKASAGRLQGGATRRRHPAPLPNRPRRRRSGRGEGRCRARSHRAPGPRPRLALGRGARRQPRTVATAALAPARRAVERARGEGRLYWEGRTSLPWAVQRTRRCDRVRA